MPTFIGEFTTNPALAIHTPCEMFSKAKDLGYSGAFPWAYRAKDDASLTRLGEDTRNCLLSFAIDNSEILKFK